MGLFRKFFGGRIPKGKLNTVKLGKKSKKIDGIESYERELSHETRKGLMQRVDIFKNKKSHEAKIGIVNEDGKHVGMLAVSNAEKFIERHGLVPGQGILSAAIVSREYQKEGLFRQMIAEAEHIAKRKMKFKILYIVPQDRRARKVYEKLGYAVVKKEGKLVESNWKRMPVMEKKL